MKLNEKKGDYIYNVVEVWRGFAENVHSFQSQMEAERFLQERRTKCDFYVDDVRMFKTRIS